MSMVSPSNRYDISNSDARYTYNHKSLIRTKSIRHGRGTIDLVVNIKYKKGNRWFKERFTGYPFQATTYKGEFIDTSFDRLVRRAYNNGVIGFKEERGISYSSNILVELVDYFIVYWGKPEGRSKGVYSRDDVVLMIPDDVEGESNVPFRVSDKKMKPIKRVKLEDKRVKKPEKRVISKKVRASTGKYKTKSSKEDIERARRLVR